MLLYLVSNENWSLGCIKVEPCSGILVLKGWLMGSFEPFVIRKGTFCWSLHCWSAQGWKQGCINLVFDLIVFIHCLMFWYFFFPIIYIFIHLFLLLPRFLSTLQFLWKGWLSIICPKSRTQQPLLYCQPRQTPHFKHSPFSAQGD